MEGFSIVIPVYKDLAGLKQTIKDLRESKIPVNHEYIVCNDGANRYISDWLSDQGIQEVAIKRRKGSYHARNQGITVAQYEHILFVDAGIVVKPGWFNLIQTASTRNDYLAFKINVDIRPEMSLLKRYSEFQEFRCDLYWQQNHFGPTAFLWVHKKVFDETGSFDEDLWSGGDLELGNRCWHANLKMAYISNDLIFHEPRSLKQKFKKQVRVLQGIKALKKKYPNRLMKLPSITWLTLLQSPFRFIWSLFRMKRLSSFKSRKFSPLQIAYAEAMHQLAYYIAMARALTSKKPQFE